MANNIDVLDAAAATKTVKTTDNASVHTPHHNVDTCSAVTAVTTVTTVSTVTNLSQMGGAAINLGAGAVASGTQRVTLASDDPGVALLTTIDADTGSILTAAQLIDDIIVAVDAVGTSAKVALAGAIRDDALSSLTPVEGDAVNLRTDANGALWVIPSGTVTISGNVTNAGTFAVQAAQSGTWTVDLGATDNAVLDSIAASTLATQTALEGTLTVASHAVTNAGTFAVQESGGALTALQIIDDWDESDRAKVNPIVGQAGIAAGAGTVGATVPRVTLASDDPAVTDLAAIEVLLTGIDADTDAIKTATQLLDNAISGSEMQVDVVASLPAGTNNIGDVDVLSIAAGTNAIGDVGLIPRTSGGLSIFRTLDLDESEEEIKGSAGQLYKLRITNFSTSPRYVKVYNNTAAGTTVGTTTPVDTITVPGATSASQPTVITESFGGQGLAFSTGITVAATTALADADTGAPGANEIVLTALYA